MKFLAASISLFLILAIGCNHPKKPQSAEFPESIGRINDFGSVFSAREEMELDSLIAGIEKRSLVEIKVISLDSTMTNLEGFNSYILRLANFWKIGKKGGKENGILIGISPALQRVRITNSLRLEMVLTDIEVKAILDDFMFPELRKGNYFKGTKLAIDELTKKLPKSRLKN
jgi:uncharacterized protein